MGSLNREEVNTLVAKLGEILSLKEDETRATLEWEESLIELTAAKSYEAEAKLARTEAVEAVEAAEDAFLATVNRFMEPEAPPAQTIF